MTYLKLLELLQKLSLDQLQTTLTVELGYTGECFPAELRICGENHLLLEDYHPVIYVNQ